jgi:hypothetical protein
MALISNLRISPNMYAQLVDAGGSAYVSGAAADDNGDVALDAPPGSYALNQGPTPTGPWTAVPNSATVVVVNSTDAPGDLTPAGAVFPGSGTGPQIASAVIAGNGVPSNGVGQNGWFYFRADGGVGSNVYKKTAGAWAAIL